MTPINTQEADEREGLKPCPFCGAPGYLGDGDHDSAFVECSADCPCNTRFQKATAAEAIAAWNRRASPAIPGNDVVADRAEFDRKTAINIRFQALYDDGMRDGEHGHYETMFIAMHEAYADLLAQKDRKLATYVDVINHGAAIARHNIDRAEAAEQALTTIRAEASWQTIETAPKAGYIIGAWLDGKWQAAEMLWDDQVEVWVHTSSDEYCEPTHWMPRPAIRTAANQGEKR